MAYQYRSNPWWIFVFMCFTLFIAGCDGSDKDSSDTTPPVITVKGANPFVVIRGNGYTDIGAIAVDGFDGALPVTVTGNVDTNTIDSYTLMYQATDVAGNTAKAARLVFVVEEGLPPHPGDKGEETIIGVDSDNDGVRDDVQITIAVGYHDSPKVQKALLQLAKAYQKAVVNYVDSEGFGNYAEENSRAVACLISASEKPSEDIFILKHFMKNTEARDNVFLEMNSSLGGKIFPVFNNPAEQCE